jgi:hypothetical protein
LFPKFPFALPPTDAPDRARGPPPDAGMDRLTAGGMFFIGNKAQRSEPFR